MIEFFLMRVKWVNKKMEINFVQGSPLYILTKIVII